MRGMALLAGPWNGAPRRVDDVVARISLAYGAVLAHMSYMAMHAKVDPRIVLMACPQRGGPLWQPVPPYTSPPITSCVAGIGKISNIH